MESGVDQLCFNSELNFLTGNLSVFNQSSKNTGCLLMTSSMFFVKCPMMPIFFLFVDQLLSECFFI
jgi:hypothetical protein